MQTPQKRKNSALTLEDSLSEIKEKRKKAKVQKKASTEDGWKSVDPDKDNFTYTKLDPAQTHSTLKFARKASLSDIFLQLYPKELVEAILSRKQEDSNKAFCLPKGTQYTPTMSKIYKYLAIRIRVQGIHEVPQENTKNRDAQRKAFLTASAYFREKFPHSPPPGINVLESLHNVLNITPAEENLLSQILQDSIASVGEWVAGDEKLFKFTGKSGWVRLVPNKPDRVGIWIYELTCRVSPIVCPLAYLTNWCQLSCGKPYLLYVRSHTTNSSVGERIPTSEVVKEWAICVQEKGKKDSMLVCDSYYLDTAGRALLKELGIKFVCSVRGDRFWPLRDLVKFEVKKSGEWAGIWNKSSKELFVHVWDPNPDIGKKYVLSNAFQPHGKNATKLLIPAYDAYKVMFNTCDQFNRALHDCTWPHRHGGGKTPGAVGALHNFYFSAILQNVLTAHFELSSQKSEIDDFKEATMKLADQLYLKATTM